MAILRSTTIIGSLTLSGPLSANEQAKATNSNFGLVKLGYTANGQNVPLKLSDDGLAYVTVPTTDLSGYLPLTGGTISGNLTVNGTSIFNNNAVFQNTAFTSGTENQVVKYRFKTASNQYGAIYFGKEGPNNGSMIRLDQVEGTPRLYFRASSTAGAIVWNQPESGSQLYFDVSKVNFRTAGYVADAASFRPSSNGTKDLGASGNKFRNVYANAFYENGTALSSKYAAVSHTHTIAQVSNLQSALDGKASVNHTHAISDVANLQTNLDGKLNVQDPSFNGTIYGPKWSGQTGSSADNHAIVIGANAKDYCDFYEYGAIWNFYKSIEGTKTLVAKIQEDGIYHNNTRLSKEGHTHTSFGDLTVNNLTVSTNLTANMASINNGLSCNGGFNQYANAYFHNDVSFDKSDSVYISGNINNGALFTRGTLSNSNMSPTDTETQYTSIWGLISPGVTTYDQITILRMRRKISGGDNVETSISFGYTFRNPPLVIVQEGGLSNATWTQYKGNTVVKSVSTTGAVIVSGKAERPPMTFLIIGQRSGSW